MTDPTVILTTWHQLTDLERYEAVERLVSEYRQQDAVLDRLSEAHDDLKRDYRQCREERARMVAYADFLQNRLASTIEYNGYQFDGTQSEMQESHNVADIMQDTPYTAPGNDR